MTLEEARAEIERARDIVKRKVEESGAGFLTTYPELGLYVWGDRINGVWITAAPSGGSPKLSDQKAARLLMQQNVRFPTPIGKTRWIHVEETDDPDKILAKLEKA